MFDGKVSLNYLKHHHSLEYEEAMKGAVSTTGVPEAPPGSIAGASAASEEAKPDIQIIQKPDKLQTEILGTAGEYTRKEGDQSQNEE